MDNNLHFVLMNKKFKEKKSSNKNFSKKTTNKEIKAKKPKLNSRQLVSNFSKLNKSFLNRITCRTNLKRDISIILSAIFIIAFFLVLGQYIASIDAQVKNKELTASYNEKLFDQFEDENAKNIEIIQDALDTSQWKEYQSPWYGFKIKYSQNWKAPVVRPYSRFSSAIYRVSFLPNDKESKSSIVGFDVAIYDMSKTKELFQTDEFPKLKDPALQESIQCKNIEGHFLETGDYPAEEIYIPAADDCYKSALFFSVVSGQYIYNIVPKIKEGTILENDLMVEVSDKLPEFFASVSSFENIEIVRPKPKAIAPKITAPKPASYKIDQFGRLVCEKKDDKPSKSNQGKGKHLDMECCLDPDEYPNPHCYYDPGKYGKYLK
ncbi:MAG: hypothetical protein UR60_C0006G0039 [Candidatus Moranbacteria bacterium GW2011_GWF2_34_56]|nr:MAG: hypothetical protein UR51_C0005G0043 [Candidatus Moranbacteria bacterium GW2011_GWF1_34_10]KKP65217.1 MAG: hypothetical protein UR60_C0006G0039 [Candidatus Moranbacteria bacterium GW2011_GWF2_34_56]